MKPREQGGVVDKDLNVYGTTGLKIAGQYLSVSIYHKVFTFLVDLSIPPANVNCVSPGSFFFFGFAPDSNPVLFRTLTQLLLRLAKKPRLLSQRILESRVFKVYLSQFLG